MVDFILGLILAGLLVRGWVRGLVSEALNLVSLVAGLWIAFRLSKPFGDFLTQSFGVTPEVARIGAGIALFVLFGVTMSIAGHYLSKMMSLPGLSMVNRVGGAAVALTWGVFLVLVLINVLRVLPIPEGVDDALESSSVARGIAGEDAVPQRIFVSVIGDKALTTLAAIQDLFGASRAIPDIGEVLEIPKALAGELTPIPGEAEEVIQEINEHRTGLGLGALQPSDALTDLALSIATDAYEAGRLAILDDCDAILERAGILVAECDSAVALASTALGALDGILEDAGRAVAIETPAFDRMGVAVVEGPTGRVLVVLTAG